MSKVVQRLPKWVKVLTAAAPERDEVRVFEDFVEMLFLCLLGKQEEAKLVASIGGEEKRLTAFLQAAEMLSEEMEKRRFEDVLGEVHQEIRGLKSQQGTGSFYTPTSLCEAMAGMACMPDKEEVRQHVASGRVYRVLDPTVGAARTLMAFAKEHSRYLEHLRFYGTDIEANACRMAFVNMALNGMAAEVRHGNDLTGEVWAVWHTPEWAAYEAQREAMKRWAAIFNRLDEMFQEQRRKSEPVQGEFDFMIRQEVR